MIINTKLTIRRPPEQVWDFFDNPDNLTKWIIGLKNYHHMNGDPGTVGAQAIYEFQENGKLVEMKDEVLIRKEPEELTLKFHHKDLDMIINYSLFEEENDTTTLICNTQYKFRNLFWELFSKIMRNKMQQRQNADLVLLKKYVELEPLRNGQ